MATKKEVVRFRLRDDQKKKLKRLCLKKGLSQNELLTQIVVDYLETEKKASYKYKQLIEEEVKVVINEIRNRK